MKLKKHLNIFFVIVVFLISFSMSIKDYNSISWTNPSEISARMPGHIWNQNLCITPDNDIHLVWQQGIDTLNYSKSRVYFSESMNGIWSIPKKISDTSITASIPLIITDKERILHSIWGQRIGPYQSGPYQTANSIYYSYRKERIWSKPEKIFESYNINTYVKIDYVLKADENNNLFLFFAYLDTTGFPKFCCKVKYPSGWTEKKILPFDAAYFDFLIDPDNTIHMALVHPSEIGSYDANSVFYAYSKDTGKTWKETLVDRSGYFEAHKTRILKDKNGILHILWAKDLDRKNTDDCFYHSYSGDGINWSKPLVIGRDLAGFIYHEPVAALDSKNNIHLFWSWTKYSFKEPSMIYYSCWNGTSWSNPAIVYEHCSIPKICIDNQDKIKMVMWDEIKSFLPYNHRAWFYSYTKDPVTKIYGKTSIPIQYTLYQNYPNPFNPSTTIEYSIPKVEYVTLKVFDVKGNLISELVNNVLTPGTYKATFDKKDISSGIYLYQLKAGTHSEMKKMILLR